MKTLIKIVQSCVISVALCASAANRIPSLPFEIQKHVKDNLVILQCDDMTGPGFIVKMNDGKPYLVTSTLLLGRRKNIVGFLSNGKQLRLGVFSTAEDRNIARFEVQDSVLDGLALSADAPKVNDGVHVFAGSTVGGIVSEWSGTVLKAASDSVEVTTPFSRAQFGAVVVDERGNVVGAASFAHCDPNPIEWTLSNTRIRDMPRITVRLADASWKSEKYDRFCRRNAAEDDHKREEAGIKAEGSASFGAAKMYSLPAKNGRGFRILSDIVLSVRGQKKNTKNPIVRVCVLVSGTNGKYYMRDCILDEVGSLTHVKKSPPIYEYGNESGGWSRSIGNGQSIYCLEGLSYYQKQYPGPTLCGLKFFDKTKDAIDGKLFMVSKDVCGEKPPEIVCYRLECWQNGSLAGFWNSASTAKLNAMHIPVDWYVRGKYEQVFDYGGKGGSLTISASLP